MRTRVDWFKVIASVLLVCGASWRLWGLASHDFWYDEGFTILTVNNPQLYFLPLYQQLVRIIAAVAGISEVSLRLVSALCNIGAMLVSFLLAKDLFGRRVALGVLCIFAFSPFQLWYAQEARDYSLLLLLGVCSTYFLMRWLAKGSRALISLYAGCVLLGALTSFPFAFLLAGHAVFLLCTAKGRLRERLPAFYAILAGVATQGVFLRRAIALTGIQKGYWVPVPDLGALSITMNNFLLGYHGDHLGYMAATILVFAAVAVFALKASLARGAGRQALIAVAIFAFLPMLGMYAFSRIFFPIYLDRALIISAPFFYMVIAWTVVSFGENPLTSLSALAFGVCVVTSAVNYEQGRFYLPGAEKYHAGVYEKKPVRTLAAFLSSSMAPGDRLVFSHPGLSLPLYHYLGYDREKVFKTCMHALDTGVKETRWQRDYRDSPLKNCPLYVTKEEALEAVRRSGGRVFLVGGDWERDGALDENSRSVQAYFDSRMRRSMRFDFDGAQITVYNQG